jgi:UrcA family protein
MPSSKTEEHIMSNRLVKLLPLAVALAMGSLVNAGEVRVTEGIPSVIVKYGDLDLNTKAGVTRLHARLRGAAREVCEPLDSRVLGLREQFEICVSDAVTRGVKDVDNSNLTFFHRYGAIAALLASD